MLKRQSQRTAAIFVVACSFAVTTEAAPLSLVMVTDKLLEGRAILSGTYSELNDGFNVVMATLEGAGAPVNWSVTVFLDKFSNDVHAEGLNVASIEARHISKPPPHAGELSPGPLLALGGVGTPLYKVLIDDFGGALEKTLAVAHDNPKHFDRLTSTLIDLNPGDPKSVTAGLSDEFRLRVDLKHTPEPSALGLMGVFGAVWLTRRMRRRARGSQRS